MKQLLSFLILLAFLLSCGGCGSTNIDAVNFFYCRSPETYSYFEQDSVIVAEGRDLTGHTGDLQYLIALYLAGPLDENLISPFPRKTRLVEVQKEDSRIRIELTDLGSSLSDAEFSLASVCLAQTCMHFSGSRQVTVRSGIRNITVRTDNVILFDNVAPDAANGGTE